MRKLINCNKQHYLVLVPHRDVRVKLRKFHDDLIKEGLNGFYSFPDIVPLAELSKPLKTDELKHIAVSLREFLGKEKIRVGELSSIKFPAGKEDMELFGYRLELDIPEKILESSENSTHGGTEDTKARRNKKSCKKIKNLISPLIIGSFLFPKINVNSEKDNINLLRASVPPCEKSAYTFTSAAVANMSWQPDQADGELIFNWNIGKLSWMPSAKKKK